MLALPGNLNSEQFLEQYWQKRPLFMPAALPRVRPSISRNELGWLATLDDVESRIVFTHREEDRVRYSAETGPFDVAFLEELPPRDWTLLVHDVEKHVPAMRKLFRHVPFIPDWRIDDLMVSFAASGGGVGPHRDFYDVFLCQGIGQRDWHVSTDAIADNADASNDLALTQEFSGDRHAVREGDVLYLPPGVAHWGTASRACMTYSIGMRAPQLCDLLEHRPDDAENNSFYTDPDLRLSEVRAGYLSKQSHERAQRMLLNKAADDSQSASALGRFATQTKDWITPERASDHDAQELIDSLRAGGALRLHGMTNIAWDDHFVYVNGAARDRGRLDAAWLESLCTNRLLKKRDTDGDDLRDALLWLAKMGAFELPETY